MTNIQTHFHLKQRYWANLGLMQFYIEANKFNHAIFHYLISLTIRDEIFENFDKLAKDQKYYIGWL